ncbi:MAG TPA: hypothetical protein VM557_01875 [Thermoanaerobaculia bacterium]|nr:hypothetical protein [Thermoanaerobaculia bacterium]
MARLLAVLSAGFVATLSGCSLLPSPATTHIAWQLEGNLVIVPAAVDGKNGRFIIGTGDAVTVLDAAFFDSESRRAVGVVLGDRFSARVTPRVADFEGLADGILGADVFNRRSVTLDFRRGLLVLGRGLDPISEGVEHRFNGTPTAPVTINGEQTLAIVDSANPDTLLLPSSRFGPVGRRLVNLGIGETSFVNVDARVEDIPEVRLGIRILSYFLVTIDYPRQTVNLWPDAR